MTVVFRTTTAYLTWHSTHWSSQHDPERKPSCHMAPLLGAATSLAVPIAGFLSYKIKQGMWAPFATLFGKSISWHAIWNRGFPQHYLSCPVNLQKQAMFLLCRQGWPLQQIPIVQQDCQCMCVAQQWRRLFSQHRIQALLHLKEKNMPCYELVHSNFKNLQ